MIMDEALKQEKPKLVLDTEWSVHLPALLKEVMNNPGCAALGVPFRILAGILEKMGERAAVLNDPALNEYMARLALYEVTDPYSKDFDSALRRRVLQRQEGDPLSRLVKVGEEVTLAGCPPGLFLFRDDIGFKTEYFTTTMIESSVPVVEAYCLESGEFFWGGTSLHSDRHALMVQPLSLKPVDRAPEKYDGQVVPAPSKSYWIDFAFKKPLDEQECLVSFRPEEGGQAVAIAIWYGDKSGWACLGATTGEDGLSLLSEGQVMSTVTHWMPLPKLP